MTCSQLPDKLEALKSLKSRDVLCLDKVMKLRLKLLQPSSSCGTIPSTSTTCKGNPLPPRLSVLNSASASDASSAFRCIFCLPTHLPPSNASSAFQCVFRFATHLTPPDLSPAPASHGMSCLPQHDLSPAVQLVSRSSRFGSSPLPTSRGITRHHATSRNIMRHTVTSRNPRGTLHLPLAFRSRPSCPATSQDIQRLPLPLLPIHPWDIPRLPGIP